MHSTDDPPERVALIDRYRHLTARVMPDLARDPVRQWPVVADHCFQRIVLDAVCGGVWYDRIARPAYRNMTVLQASAAVELCEAIIDGSADIRQLNHQSLRWRGKLRAR